MVTTQQLLLVDSFLGIFYGFTLEEIQRQGFPYSSTAYKEEYSGKDQTCMELLEYATGLLKYIREHEKIQASSGFSV